MEHVRLSKKEYLFNICKEVSKRSTCIRRQVGAIAVSPSGNIVSTGYNGAPKGAKHCTEKTCKRINIPSGTMHERCKAVHGEMNLVCEAAEHGISLKGCTIYSTHKPCSICMKLLINSGIVKVLYLEDYPDDLTKELVDDPGVNIELVKVTL